MKTTDKNSGSMVAKGNQTILESEIDAQAEAPISGLALHVKEAFRRADEHRNSKNIEATLNGCLLQRQGEYTAEEKARFDGIDVFRNVTGAIIRSAVALIQDTYFSAEDRPFTVEATPLPELSELSNRAVQIAVIDIAKTVQRNGSQVDFEDAQKKLTETAIEIANDEVAGKCKAMERLIEDQLMEGGWRDAFALVINDICTFPVGIIKGPIVKNVKQAKWNGSTLESKMLPILSVERVSPFDFYPSPDSTNCQDGEFVIERMRMPRGKFADCRTLPNFRPEAIEALLHERQTNSDAKEIIGDYAREQSEKVAKDFHTVEILDFWGRVSGRSILEFFEQDDDIESAETKSETVKTEWGEIDPFQDYEINIWLAGDYVVRAMMNPSPLCTRPYHAASFSISPGSFWGDGIPQLLKDVQTELNAAARARVYNLGFASGPVIEVDVDQFEEGQTPKRIAPWSILYTRGNSLSSNKSPIRFHQANSNSGELGVIMQEAYSKAFEITGIPPYMQGFDQGSAKTLGAFSMQYANALKGIKQVIGNVDRGIIERLVEQFYYFNLFYTDDETIKADAKVKARGAAGIMAMESKQARPLETIQKLGPLLKEVSPEALPGLVGEYMKQSGYNPSQFGLPGSTSERELKKINLSPPPIDGRSGPAVNAMKNSTLPAPI
jgi:hypothetical protein